MIRTDPQPGDIGFTTITGPVGWLIRFAQWLNGDGFSLRRGRFLVRLRTWLSRRGRFDGARSRAYQHAFIVLPGKQLIEAMPGGAIVDHLSKYDDRPVLYASPADLTPAQRKAITDCALKYVGVPYSFLDYLALALHRFHIPWPGLRRYIQTTGHLICSQLADRAYLDAGQHLFDDGRWEGYVTPMSLANQLIMDRIQREILRAFGVSPHQIAVLPTPRASKS